MRTPIVAWVSAGLVLALGPAGCSSDPPPPPTASSPPAAASTPAPEPSAAATTVGALSPFTGEPVTNPDRPVFAVKIDNVAPARPQTGLEKADIVYVEPVEGGLSRILAVFSSALPERIGPVRSARESDLELLAQYGRPALVYSGANKRVLAAIGSAPVVDLSPDQVPGAFSRTSAKKAPHNLLVEPARLRKTRGISTAADIGFRFGDLPAGQGTATTRKSVRYGAARSTFTWSPQRRRWNVSLDGQPATTTAGTRLGAATVVVQYTKITASALRDVLGNATPYPHTVGSGKAVVLRDGVAVTADWSRPTAEAGTTFTTTDGTALPFAAGPVWIIYAAA